MGVGGARSDRTPGLLAASAAPPGNPPPPLPRARAGLWVTPGRQVTANGGGRLSWQAAVRASGTRQNVPAPLIPIAASPRWRRCRRAMDRQAMAAAGSEGAGGPGPGPAGGWRPPRVAGAPPAGSRQPSVETLDR